MISLNANVKKMISECANKETSKLLVRKMGKWDLMRKQNMAL